MTPEEKELLLKDLSARIPYQPLCKITGTEYDFCECDRSLGYSLRDFVGNNVIIKPYLRPMLSITEEERKELSIILNYEFYVDDDFALVAEDDRHRIRLELCECYIDWLNAHHFDFRGLIEKGLAIEAPEGMYNKEESEEESEIPIPKTVDEAVKTLAKILSKEDRDYLLENGAISMHDSLGRWIRNEWGLWTGSELKDEMMNMNKGLNHQYWNNKV